jgi:hypothetical protein
VLAAAATCKVSTDLSRDLAIEVTAPDSLEEYDTLKPTARVLTGHGDSAATAVFWFSPDTTIAVLDSSTGRTVVAHTGGTGRLVARGGGLVSNPVSIRTLAAADTVSAAGATADTVSLARDSLSDSLKVALADTIESSTGTGSLTVPLAGRPVVYVITYPTTAGAVTLVDSDTARALVTADTVVTGSAGVAFVKVRLLAPPVPDSVVIVASAQRAVGTPVRGSPITFTVRFEP